MDPFFLFMIHVCQASLSVHYSFVVTCLERANLLALLCVFFIVFHHIPVWCLGSKCGI